jgi:predicted nucleic acid-binding protein
VYFDANIVIYAVEGVSLFLDRIRILMSALNEAEIIGVTSELTIAETLIKPLKEKQTEIQRAYQEFLTPTPGFRVIPINRPILEEAARLRATTRLKLPDAIHLATALHLQCDSFVTNDDLFRSLGLNQIKMLTDLDLL